MPPISRLSDECLNTTRIDLSLAGTAKPNTDQDIHALLYIVCTLLFYSLGIIVGIVKYLKQEKQDIEESKMFDDFIALKSDFSKGVFTFYKRRQVHDVIQKLEEIERKRFLLETNTYANSQLIIDGEIKTDSVCSEQNRGVHKLNVVEEESVNKERIDFHTLETSVCIEENEPLFETERAVVVMSDACDASVMATGDVDDDMGNKSEQCDEMTDPFPNRRLSQVVARILDSNLNIHECDDLDTTYEDITEDELETDFIDYNEEPKNKELFRGSYREFTDSLIFDSEPMKDSVFEEDVDDKLLVSMQSRQVETADGEEDITDCPGTVTTTTDSRGTETVFDVAAGSQTGGKDKLSGSSVPSIQSIRRSSCEETPFRWSVTSV